jgi:hypothetical protein
LQTKVTIARQVALASGKRISAILLATGDSDIAAAAAYFDLKSADNIDRKHDTTQK